MPRSYLSTFYVSETDREGYVSTRLIGISLNETDDPDDERTIGELGGYDMKEDFEFGPDTRMIGIHTYWDKLDDEG